MNWRSRVRGWVLIGVAARQAGWSVRTSDFRCAPFPRRFGASPARRVVTCVLIASAPVLSSCMMTGGMGGMTRTGPATAVSTSSVIGEARTASARVTLEFPAVTVGQDATLVVRVVDAAGAPISGVRVAVLLRHGGGDTTALAVTAAQSALGVYEAAHRFPTAGVHTATAEVLIDQGNPSSVVSVAVRQEVLSGAMDGPGRRSSFLPIALLGTAAMAAMMVLMIAL